MSRHQTILFESTEIQILNMPKPDILDNQLKYSWDITWFDRSECYIDHKY